MKYRRLDENGDYSFGAGSHNYCSGDEAIAQAVKTKILLFYNEWWEDLGIGIPMFQSFIGQTNPETIKVSMSNVIDQRIREISGIKSVKNVDVKIDRETRTMSFEIDIVTYDDSEIIVEVSF